MVAELKQILDKIKKKKKKSNKVSTVFSVTFFKGNGHHVKLKRL